MDMPARPDGAQAAAARYLNAPFLRVECKLPCLPDRRGRNTGTAAADAAAADDDREWTSLLCFWACAAVVAEGEVAVVFELEVAMAAAHAASAARRTGRCTLGCSDSKDSNDSTMAIHIIGPSWHEWLQCEFSSLKYLVSCCRFGGTTSRRSAALRQTRRCPYPRIAAARIAAVRIAVARIAVARIAVARIAVCIRVPSRSANSLGV